MSVAPQHLAACCLIESNAVILKPGVLLLAEPALKTVQVPHPPSRTNEDGADRSRRSLGSFLFSLRHKSDDHQIISVLAVKALLTLTGVIGFLEPALAVSKWVPGTPPGEHGGAK